jgi:hypothetical protein
MLVRADRQVVYRTGEGSFIFGPAALWHMARLEFAVTTIVSNNHAHRGLRIPGCPRSVEANRTARAAHRSGAEASVEMQHHREGDAVPIVPECRFRFGLTT